MTPQSGDAPSESTPGLVEHNEKPQQHNNNHHHVAEEASMIMPWYQPPRQRQRWGDTQLPPHTDWGDIFFDLFYVAAAYNLGSLLREDPTRRGLLYISGYFLPIIYIWTQNMAYRARFYLANDVFHRLFEVAALLPLATAVWEIRTTAILSNPQEYSASFVYSLAITISQFLIIFRYLEIILSLSIFKTAEVDKFLFPEAFAASVISIAMQLLSACFYLAAAIYTGLQYNSSTSYNYNDAYETGDSSVDNSTDSVTADDGHRHLAESASIELSSSSQDDNAAWMFVAASVFYLVFMTLYYGVFLANRRDFAKRTSVPMNITYNIHRYGEWVMLMLGESILSLLVVDVVESSEYYQIFFCGIVSTILLQFLHFAAQPHNPDFHAMRRDVKAAMTFVTLMMIYSISLVILGTCFKMLLYESVYAADAAKTAASESYDSSSSGENAHRALNSLLLQRFLAGGESAALRFTTEDRQQRVAHFFSGSLAIVWFCVDGISMAHMGFEAKTDIYKNIQTIHLRVLYVIIVILKITNILYFATLSQMKTEPKSLAWSAFFGTVLQLFTRVVGNIYFPCIVVDHHEDTSTHDLIKRYAKARLKEVELEKECNKKVLVDIQ